MKRNMQRECRYHRGKSGRGMVAPRLGPQGAGAGPPAGRLEAPTKPGSGQEAPLLAALSPRGGPGNPAGKAGLTMLNSPLCTCQLKPC